MTITYRLDPQDSLAGLLAKLQAAPGERILFVVPDDVGGVPALTAVGLRALRRAAVQGQVSLAAGRVVLIEIDPKAGAR